MLTTESPFVDSPHQFSSDLEAFAASQHEVQDMLVAGGVDPQGDYCSLVLAQANSVKHQRTPRRLAKIFAAQFIKEFSAGFLPKTRNTRPLVSRGLWLDLLDGSRTHARNDGLYNLSLQLLGSWPAQLRSLCRQSSFDGLEGERLLPAPLRRAHAQPRSLRDSDRSVRDGA